jgi:hypothetical protein
VGGGRGAADSLSHAAGPERCRTSSKACVRGHTHSHVRPWLCMPARACALDSAPSLATSCSLAPKALAVQRVYGEECCTTAEVPDAALQQAMPHSSLSC